MNVTYTKVPDEIRMKLNITITIPLKMDDIQVRAIQNGTMIVMEMDILWNGNCDIQLHADFIGNFGVRHIHFGGRLCLWFQPLTNELPVVSAIQYAFGHPPYVSLDFTGLAQVADLMVLDSAVRDAIHSSLLCAVLPQRMLYKMQANNNFLDTYIPPTGVLRVTVLSGRGFVSERRLLQKDDVPDIYLNITVGPPTGSISQVNHLWKTTTIRDDCNPIWKDETSDFLLYDPCQRITVNAWDHDSGPLDADDDLGQASIRVDDMLMATNRSVELQLYQTDSSRSAIHSKPTGAFVTISCQLLPWSNDWTSLEEDEPSNPNPNPNSSQEDSSSSRTTTIRGLLVVVMNRALNLPVPRESASSFVRVSLGGTVWGESKRIDHSLGIDALNPAYDSAIEIPFTASNLRSLLWKTDGDKNRESVLIFQVMNGADPQHQQKLGTIMVNLHSLRDLPDHTLTEQREFGTSGASLEYRVSLCGVAPPKNTPSLLSSSSTTANEEPSNDVKIATPGASPPKSLPSPTRRTVEIVGRSLPFDDANGETTSHATKSAAGTSAGASTASTAHLGTIRLTIVKARGLKVKEELFNIDVPDVYCQVAFGSFPDIWKTSVQRNSCVPTWDESKEYPLTDQGEIITIDVFDTTERDHDAERDVGSAKVTVGKVLLAGGCLDVELKNRRTGIATGVIVTIQCDFREWY